MAKDILPAKQKNHAANLSLAVNLLLAIFKTIGAVYSGSAALLSEALHSVADVLSSFITNIGIKKAGEPADADHPYGHARIEAVAGLAESSFLVVVALFAFYHSVQHLVKKEPVSHALFAVVLLLICSLVSLVTGRYVGSVAKKTQSLALKSNSLHLESDFVASFAVFLALVGVWLAGWTWLDGALGLFVSGWLIFVAMRNGNEAIQQLIDHALPEPILAEVRRIVESNPGVLSYHRLRSRVSGTMKIIDMHIVLPAEFTLVQAHAIADSIEAEIKREYAPAIVVIHMDPYDPIKAKRPKPSAE